MTINKNIMKKIMDNVALNEWKNKVKDINGEYHHYFKWNECLTLNISNYPECGKYPLYTHRHYMDGSSIWSGKIIKCPLCDKYHPSVIGNVIKSKIPEKYYFSSGLNHRRGYKKLK